MNQLKICCSIKNMQAERREWEVNILVYESSILSEEEKNILTTRNIIENSTIDERKKRRYQKKLSASYYVELMQKGYTYEEIYTLLKEEFNKYYDRPNSNAIVSALAFEIDCLKLAAKKIANKESIDLFEIYNLEEIGTLPKNQLIKKRSL